MKAHHLMALGLLLTSMGAVRAEKISVSTVLEGMEETWKGTEAYTCTMKTWGTRAGREKAESFRFAFHKPRLVRLKVLSGANRGADVVYDAAGKVRGGKKVLGMRVSQSIKLTDPKVRSARGVPFWEADMGSQITAIRTLIKEKGAEATAEKTPAGVVVRLTWKGTDLSTDTGTHEYVKTWTLDPKTWAPLTRATTEDGTAVERVEVTDMDLKADVAAGYFKL